VSLGRRGQDAEHRHGEQHRGEQHPRAQGELNGFRPGPRATGGGRRARRCCILPRTTCERSGLRHDCCPVSSATAFFLCGWSHAQWRIAVYEDVTGLTRPITDVVVVDASGERRRSWMPAVAAFGPGSGGGFDRKHAEAKRAEDVGAKKARPSGGFDSPGRAIAQSALLWDLPCLLWPHYRVCVAHRV
jgi:hypothetical protein